MTITYCCVIAKASKILLAEYPKASGGSNWMRASNLLTKLQNGAYMDYINIEDNQMVTYVRTKHIIITCFSVENEKESMRVFLDELIWTLKKQFIKLEKLISTVVLAKFCQQTNLYPILIESIEKFNRLSDEKSISNEKILIEETENKNEILIKNQTIDKLVHKKSHDYSRLILISVIVIIAIFLIYGLISYIRCANFINLFCSN